MTGYKVFIKYLLWRIGLKRALPGAIINNKPIRESGELLEDFGGFLVRRSVANRLSIAQKSLPKGIYIKVLSGYRSLDEQWKLWNENPDSSRIANPRNGGGGHQTGGAVDVTLIDADGNELDMGCGYLEFGCKTATTAGWNKNRKMLYDAMVVHAGFINYPNECWHYSYGDKMWAAYARKKYAIYGAV